MVFLLLDPSGHSTLELVKSRDALSARRDGITLCGWRGTLEVNIGESALRGPAICSAPSQRSLCGRSVRVKE